MTLERSQHRPARRRALVCALMAGTATLALAPAALAQEAPPSASVDEIVVTGTRAAPRSRLETVSPVDVINEEALDQAASLNAELGQALQLTVPSFNIPRQSNSGPADVVRAATLRGLSPDQTLVLINGHRRHTTAIVNLESKIGRGTTPVDFNAIPSTGIGRVEVLRDGAGALYGSDAIAGVVNIILDSRTGGELTLTYGAHITDFEPTGEDITDGETFTLTGAYGWALSGGGFVRAGFEFSDRQETARGGPDQIPFFEAFTPPNLALQGEVNYRPGDPETQTLSLFVNAERPLDATNTLYGFATYSDREGRGAGFFRYPDSSVNVPSIYPEGYLPVSVIESRDLQLVGGWRREAGAWSLDASLNYGLSDYDFGLENSLNPSLGTASPTSFDLGTYRADLFSVNLDATREFDIGLASPLGLAVGAEYRRETFETGAGEEASYIAGPVTGVSGGAQAYPGLRPEDTVDIDRDVFGIYAEATADVTPVLTLTGALRLEDYSDFGSALAGKLGARWQVNEVVAVRGSVSNSFRAPSLSQVGTAFSVLTRGTGGALETVRTVQPTSPIGQALGVAELEEETSVNLTAGLVIDLRPLVVTIDVYRIDVDDRITLSERIGEPGLEAFILAETGISGVTSVNLFTNAVDTRTEGVDIVATWSGQLWGGDLDLSGGLSIAETEIRSVDATPAPISALGAGAVLLGVEERNTLVDAAPDSKLIAQADWTRGPWGLTARATRYGETTRVFNFGGGFEPEQTYGAETQIDLEARFTFDRGVTLAVGGQNVLDEYPDLSSADINYFGNLPYDVLSPIGFNGAYWYGRLAYRF